MKFPILPKNVQLHKNPPVPDTGWRSLSQRERQIVEFLLKGYTHSRIALKLGISKGTVVKYVIKIKQKLGLEGKAAEALKSWNKKMKDPKENSNQKR